MRLSRYFCGDSLFQTESEAVSLLRHRHVLRGIYGSAVLAHLKMKVGPVAALRNGGFANIANKVAGVEPLPGFYGAACAQV